MSILYRSVLIESAEQAEALPKGSVLFDGGHPEDGDTYLHMGGDWHTDGYPGLLAEALDLGFVMTALVPLEAEETRSEGTGWIVPTAFGPKLLGAYLGSPDDTPARRYTQTTWRTPWEEQS